jgi:hypothetical protein
MRLAPGICPARHTAVLDGGGGDHHIQHEPDRVDGDVPLAAVDLLGVIPAPCLSTIYQTLT